MLTKAEYYQQVSDYARAIIEEFIEENEHVPDMSDLTDQVWESVGNSAMIIYTCNHYATIAQSDLSLDDTDYCDLAIDTEPDKHLELMAFCTFKADIEREIERSLDNDSWKVPND